MKPDDHIIVSSRNSDGDYNHDRSVYESIWALTKNSQTLEYESKIILFSKIDLNDVQLCIFYLETSKRYRSNSFCIVIYGKFVLG